MIIMIEVSNDRPRLLLRSPYFYTLSLYTVSAHRCCQPASLSLSLSHTHTHTHTHSSLLPFQVSFSDMHVLSLWVRLIVWPRNGQDHIHVICDGRPDVTTGQM